MSRLRFTISMSLDGIVAGSGQGLDNPLGIGGMRLHQWVFPRGVWRSMHGLPGGKANESTHVAEDSLANIGATVTDRDTFGVHPGSWDYGNRWDGWWRPNPPFHHPAFVRTHHPREPLEMEDRTSFTFVTDGIQAALYRARRAAGGKDVALAGGAGVARQQLVADLVDEMEISLVPRLLGCGERLFDGVGDDLLGLELARMVAAPQVTHLKLARR